MLAAQSTDQLVTDGSSGRVAITYSQSFPARGGALAKKRCGAGVVSANTGIIVAYEIAHATDSIDAFVGAT